MFVGGDVVGTASMVYYDVTRYVKPGWKLNKTERGENTLDFTLGNPAGKFTDDSLSDYLEIAEDFPVVLTRDQSIYYHGLVFKPPVSDASSGTRVTISSTSRLYIMGKEDVVRRYSVVDFPTVEDVIYDIIYNATALNSYYGITYTKADPGSRHKLLRNFIFNNKDARSCIKEIIEYHNLNINMTVDTDGVDIIALARSQVKNRALSLTNTLDDSNTLNMDRVRGSDVFFNKVKVIGKDENGTVFVGEQQDVDSIKVDGLRVRPTQNIGTVTGQIIVQRYAEYLIAKFSRDNYTTTITVDPTKLNEDELWALEPLSVVKVTNTRVGIGTNAKMRVASVNITGNTDDLTSMTINLNHIWRSIYVMQFDEMPTVYDDDQELEDEELIESRLMTAMVDVEGAWSIYDTGENYYPTTTFADGGYPGLSDMGKMLIKTNWLKNPEYSSAGVPADPLTMRISKVWPLKEDGSVYGIGAWSEHADGFENEATQGANGSNWYSLLIAEYNITTSHAYNIYGLMACSRYGGTVLRYGDDDPGFPLVIKSVIVDDPQFLKVGMNITLVDETASGAGFSILGKRITSVDYTTGEVGVYPTTVTSGYTGGTVYWYSDCYPVATAMFDSAYAAASSATIKLRYLLRFTNQYDTYSPSNLSVVTKKGMESINNRLRYDYFDEVPDGTNAQSYPPPTFMSIGMNDLPTIETAVDDDDTALNHEVARTTYIETIMSDITTVSDSAKITSKFSNLDIPPQVARSELSYAATTTTKIIYVDSNEGMARGDHIFFGSTYTEAALRPNMIESIGGYDATYSGHSIGLRHVVGGTGSLAIDTPVSTGKIKENTLRPVLEMGIWDREATEHTDTGYFFGERTGDSVNISTVTTDEDIANSGMGFGDFQYDHMGAEDSLAKVGTHPPFAPYYMGPDSASTFDYLKHIKGYGMTTVPLSSMKSGKLDAPITYSKETVFGRTPPLDEVLRKFTKDVSGLAAASQISPLGANSYSLTEHKGRKERTSYYPSKWRPYQGQAPRSEKSFWFSNEQVLYENFFASEMYIFNVSTDIGRRDFKDFNLVWRGSGKSYDSGYKDGVYFYVWHHGDYQPEYQQSSSGVYENIGTIGDARTYFPHWDYIEMVDGTGAEVDNAITGNYNRFNILTSRLSIGSDNKDGINRAGYYLSEDGKVYVLAVTKYKGSYSNKRLSSINTDFIGMSIGTSNILSGQEIFFQEGIDYLYDPDWDFIAWPNLDLSWTGAVYEEEFNLLKVGVVTKIAYEGSYLLYTDIEDDLVNSDDVLILENGEVREAVVAASSHTGFWRKVSLTAMLRETFPIGTNIYKHFYNHGPIHSNILGTQAKTNYPSRTFVQQPLTTREGLSALLTEDEMQGSEIWNTELGGGFRDDDVVVMQRFPDIDHEYRCAYEWKTNTTDGSIIVSDGIEREDIDNDGVAYSKNFDRSAVGLVKYGVPDLDSGMALSILVGGGAWEHGDAAGSKWMEPNRTWGKLQYPFLEGTVKAAAGTLFASRDPLTSVGTGYAGWDAYGGPGVKIEYYDRDNGEAWVTKAIDMTLYDGGGGATGNTDSLDHFKDFVFYKVSLDIDAHDVDGDLQIESKGGIDVSQSFNSYDNANRTPTSSGNAVHQYPIMIARNGIIKLHENNTGYGSGGDMYYQLSLASMEDGTTHPFTSAAEQELLMKYRCLESSTSTLIQKGRTTDPDKTWYLDVPMFEHDDFGTGSGQYRYHDADDGNVWFVIDAVLQGSGLEQTDSITTEIIAGDDHFHITAGSTNFEKYDIVLFREGSNMEMVQVTSKPDANTINVSTPFLNAYSVSANVEWDFDRYNTRIAIKCTQVYRTLEVDEILNLSTRIFRGGRYEMVYGEETGNLLVYSLLKDGTIYRPIEPDRADSIQVIQEVKFNYLEKDMV